MVGGGGPLRGAGPRPFELTPGAVITACSEGGASNPSEGPEGSAATSLVPVDVTQGM